MFWLDAGALVVDSAVRMACFHSIPVIARKSRLIGLQWNNHQLPVKAIEDAP